MFLFFAIFIVIATTSVAAQSANGTIHGRIHDDFDAVVPGVTVTLLNVHTNARRIIHSDQDGRYRLLNVPAGTYELTAERDGLATYLRTGVVLLVDQSAAVDIHMRPAAIAESVEVLADAAMLNTTSAEVGVRFDRVRIAELPIRSSRNVFALALSAPGVSELGSGQTEFAGENRTGFSVNGMRLRSNSWIIDGQDNNDPNANNRYVTINNPDIVDEIRLITGQFSAEFGGAAGSVVRVITKSGTNSFHGSAFIFHNDDSLNSRSNLDKSAGLAQAPYREENQFGGTLGGRIAADRTFFFGSYQRWTDRLLGSGFTLDGAPTEAGRQILQAVAGDRPQVRALLQHLPAGNANGRSATFSIGDRSYTVPLGSLTGSSQLGFDNNQASTRLDHRITPRHTLVGRYLLSNTPRNSGGDIQVTPPGLTSNNPTTRHSLNSWITSVFGSSAANELRAAWSHIAGRDHPLNAASLDIPSIEIVELGMTGSLKTRTRTAIGAASNLPNFRHADLYQLQNTFTLSHRNHLLKTGFDIRSHYLKSYSFPAIRGLLRYPTLNAFVADVAEAASVNKPLPGGSDINYYRWWDQYYFVQDEWRVKSRLTLALGLRYELPGNTIQSLVDLNERILGANADNPLFALDSPPRRDIDNVEPRVGFSWTPAGERQVVRGGYARSHEHAFLNIPQNIAASFPFVASTTWSQLANAYMVVQSAPGGIPPGSDPNLFARTTVAEDFRSPVADQVSLEVQREIRSSLLARVGYIGTFGHDLFQTVDGNPRTPFSTERVNPRRGAIRQRGNTAKSWYHSIQTQIDQRLSNGVSAGVHYTWSRFDDTASDIFNTSVSEVAIAQDSFDLDAERARSTYDRPHRLTGNVVWELPRWRHRSGWPNHVLGGWQISSFFTFQSGAPFTVLNGTDPTGALAGIDALVGNAIRPNLNTQLPLGRMSIEEIRRAGGASLFRSLCGHPSPICRGERVGNVPRNSLRSDGIENIDVALSKNTRFAKGQAIQVRIELFNVMNKRNFGVPDGRINSANFLNQWATDGGSRRIWIAVRYTF